jgi:hypothetical protein
MLLLYKHSLPLANRLLIQTFQFFFGLKILAFEQNVIKCTLLARRRRSFHEAVSCTQLITVRFPPLPGTLFTTVRSLTTS